MEEKERHALRDLKRYVSITEKKAIVLGNLVSCDGHEEGISIRVVTHVHQDHVISIGRSLSRCRLTISTKPTRDLLGVLYNVRPYRVLGLDYRKALDIQGSKLWLEKANHIIGACQVVLDHADGLRIVYTGDFKQPGTPVVDADILVMEATYGSPSLVRPSQEVIYHALLDVVRKSLSKGPVYIYGYHGKLQEAMQLLTEAGIEAPFIAPLRVYRVSQICLRYGMRLKAPILIESEEGREIMKSGWYVAFLHSSSGYTSRPRGTSIILSGWEFSGPIRFLGENRYIVALSDHADFKQLIEYVESSRPRLVITDNSREGYAAKLAKEIEKRLKIKATPMPPVRMRRWAR